MRPIRPQFVTACAAANAVDGNAYLRRASVIELEHTSKPLAAANLAVGLADVIRGRDQSVVESLVIALSAGLIWERSLANYTGYTPPLSPILGAEKARLFVRGSLEGPLHSPKRTFRSRS